VGRIALLLLLSLGAILQGFSPAWGQKGVIKIKIATQTPLSGEQADIGEQIKLGAQLAAEEATKRFRKLGFDLVFVPYDDQAKPEVGVANARSIVADPDILLIIGHWFERMF